MLTCLVPVLFVETRVIQRVIISNIIASTSGLDLLATQPRRTPPVRHRDGHPPRLRRGASEIITIEDVQISALLRAASRLSTADALLVPGGTGAFRRRWKAYLKLLSLDSFGFNLYSLRRGGAT